MQLNDDDDDDDDVYDHDRGVMIMMVMMMMMMMMMMMIMIMLIMMTMMIMIIRCTSNSLIILPPSLPQYPLDRRGHQCQCGLVEGSRDPFALQVG